MKEVRNFIIKTVLFENEKYTHPNNFEQILIKMIAISIGALIVRGK